MYKATGMQDPVVQPLRMLPRDRKTLDFVLSRLAATSSPERFDLLQELFEMHRTSIGFDPAALSKARFKRFKAVEIKKVLAELEQDLAAILSSEDYTSLVESHFPSRDLFDQYTAMLEMLSAPPSKELNDQVDKFCMMLMKEGAHELLLSFYRKAQKHFEKRPGNPGKIIEDYSSLLAAVEFNSRYFLTGLQTIKLQKEGPEVPTQEELLLHHAALLALINKSSDRAVHAELLSRLIQTCLLLNNRINALQPHIQSLQAVQGFEKVCTPETAATAILYNSALAPMERRVQLETLAQSLSKNDAGIIYIKTGLAVLHADNNEFKVALIRLNEAEHLLLRNGFRNEKMQKAWIELNKIRFFTCIANELSGNETPMSDYNIIIQAVRESNRTGGYASPAADAMRGIAEYIKSNEMNALSCFEALPSAYLKGDGNYFMKLTALFYSMLRKMPAKKIQKSVNEVVELSEPFYSTSFVNMVTASAKK